MDPSEEAVWFGILRLEINIATFIKKSILLGQMIVKILPSQQCVERIKTLFNITVLFWLL